mmetsp:Transcript_42161/g.101759  ORF Transcript_42161/g.101759 Transcript_42161/m.101759 type:complete len:128 (+) Transcript_42161:569-952(+)
MDIEIIFSTPAQSETWIALFNTKVGNTEFRARIAVTAATTFNSWAGGNVAIAEDALLISVAIVCVAAILVLATLCPNCFGVTAAFFTGNGVHNAHLLAAAAAVIASPLLVAEHTELRNQKIKTPITK